MGRDKVSLCGCSPIINSGGGWDASLLEILFRLFHFSPARFRYFDAGSFCSALFDSYPNPGARIEFFFVFFVFLIELPTDRLGTGR